MSVFGTRVTNPSQHLQTFQTIPYKLMWLHILQIKNLHFFFSQKISQFKKKSSQPVRQNASQKQTKSILHFSRTCSLAIN